MASYLEMFCGLAAVFLALYYYLTATFNFWKIRGIVGPRPIPLFGNLKNVMLRKENMGDFTVNLYQEYRNEPVIGIFEKRAPTLLVHDPELIKDVLIKDFSKFSDRGFHVPERIEPLTAHLFNLKPQKWRPLRLCLSPVFTAGKMKEMFPLITECTSNLEKYLAKVTASGEPVECCELTAKFTTDVIGSCAFGIETNALAEENSEFRRLGRKVFAPSIIQSIKFTLRQCCPQLYNLLGYVLPYNDITKFFTKVIVDSLDYRQKNDVFRPDFVNMLLELRKHPEKLGNLQITDTLLTAQAYVFFIAGFETSSTTMSNALYNLARRQNIQDKLRKEITELYAKNNGVLKYDDIKGMTYLELVFRETLRLHPPGPVLFRKSVQDYKFDGVKCTIPKDTFVWIPVYAIHHDPHIYPDPDEFIPERFTEENRAARHLMNYLPFGDGPRNCIGARFANYQTKLGLITILRNYTVGVCEKTNIPYKIDPATFLLTPKGGIYLSFSKIEN